MSSYDYFLVIDFEATCEKGNNKQFYPHEIIEFPCYILHVQSGELVGHFHSYVKPEINPVLSIFCQGLTGITQDLVDEAKPFIDVEEEFLKFVKDHIPNDKKSIVLTDGSGDIKKFLALQYLLRRLGDPLPNKNTYIPEWASEWIDVKIVYQKYNKVRHCKLQDMLKTYGLPFQGRLHSGDDDAFNISQLVLVMMSQECVFEPNVKISSYHLQVLNKNLLSYLKSRKRAKAYAKNTVHSSLLGSLEKYNREKAGTDICASGGMDIDPDVLGCEKIFVKKCKQ